MGDMVGRLTAALRDRYRVERELGAGGMATVYLAHDLRHDRDVAIKVLHPDLGAALGGDRFLSEIRTTARLQHPHILPLLDSGEADGLLYYVMPLVTGETLRARLERERQLPIADAVRIAREVASALDYAHRQNVIHRDIKPENILLHDGSALVADFGIALAVQSAGGKRMTQTGLSLGTPQYMSPEQAMGERTIDARSDIYALGAVTYEMLAGEPPFAGPTVQAIVARVMTEEPRGLTVQRKAIAPFVEDAVLRALEKLPADRFATAGDFAAALDTRTATEGTRASRAPRTLHASRTARRDRLVIGVLGVLTLASGVAALRGWRRPAAPAEVVRYSIVIDSVPAVKDWSGEVAISPDGATIVRSGGPGGALLVRHRDELAFAPLPGTEGASGPFFSPDGTRIGFYANGTLWATPLAGGPLVAIADSLPAPESVSWGSDGSLYRSYMSGGLESIVRHAPRPGAAIERLTAVDTAAGEVSHLHPELLPDGRTVLFQVDYRTGRRKIARVRLGDSTHRPILDGIRARYSVSGHMVFTTVDGKLWAVPFDPADDTTSGAPVQVGDRIPSSIIGPVDFAVSASGTLVYSVDDASARRELAWVSRAGTRQLLDSTWRGEFSSPVLSPDGSRIAVVRRDGERADLWVKPLSGGDATKLTAQFPTNVEPAWSADGQWVSYLAGSGSANTGDVWRQRADGSGTAERIVRSPRALSEQIWAPAGNILVVRTTTPTIGSGDILGVRPGVDTVLSPLVATSRPEYSPAVSPDGRWLAYASNPTGRMEIYVTPFGAPTSARFAISASGGITPRWSHRGDELFYLDLRSNLVAVKITTVPSFAVQGTRVLFDASDFIQISISRRNFDVGSDDQRFLMVQRADGSKRGKLVVVEHWADEIRRTTERR